VKSKSLIVLLFLLLVFSPTLFAQSRETGAIVGTIVDEQNTPLPGVSVTLTSPNLMGERTFVSEADGSYRFPALRPGVYKLERGHPPDNDDSPHRGHHDADRVD
jgi:protocatechuate 3,4-dioxygenase beta subunit